ncbi:MAG: hypothetical protein V4584_02950 [Verrucomicrobiota bacterium]
MRVITTVSICIASLGIAAVALLGGLFQQSFCRYVPDTPPGSSAFTLILGPQFTGGSFDKVIIPLLYRRSGESTRDPQVFVDLTDNTLVRGYNDKNTITLSSVEITNETGQAFSLIPAGAARTFPVDHSGFGQRREALGAIVGERLTITAEGFTTDKRGTDVPFRQTLRWKVDRFSRTNLAAFE